LAFSIAKWPIQVVVTPCKPEKIVKKIDKK
jgi:hypothetical protein